MGRPGARDAGFDCLLLITGLTVDDNRRGIVSRSRKEPGRPRPEASTTGRGRPGSDDAGRYLNHPTMSSRSLAASLSRRYIMWPLS